MTDFKLREMILEHIRALILENIDNIKHCRTDIDRATNNSRRETLFEIHHWINEETREV